MHQHYHSSTVVHLFIERRKIDLPTVIVEQRIRNEFHILQVGEKFEQRITRLGYQNLIFWIAQQPENVGIAFTGAAGEDHGFRIDFLMAIAVITSNGLACAAQSLWLRVVIHGAGMVERLEDGSPVVTKSGSSRIRDG